LMVSTIDIFDLLTFQKMGQDYHIAWSIMRVFISCPAITIFYIIATSRQYSHYSVNPFPLSVNPGRINSLWIGEGGY
jgi:hypothetical protein